MQDAQVGIWLRESQVSAVMIESVRELNRRFLDLVARGQGDWAAASRGPSTVSARVASLSAAQKSAAADCPYALFDLCFNDAGHWRSRLRAAGQGSVADEIAVDADTLEFVRLALFFAWHVAATTELAARLLLGMHEATAAAFHGATIDCLPMLAASEAKRLTARWNNCSAYWGALTGAACRPNKAALRRVQLYGLQLTAAVRLTPSVAAEYAGPGKMRSGLRGVGREV